MAASGLDSIYPLGIFNNLHFDKILGSVEGYFSLGKFHIYVLKM